ncbi:MAG: hypothetical protein JKY70_00150 [Mucilaginibacter sp.]|nr:hypothetical protein [Mucilaginibacter sp.]
MVTLKKTLFTAAIAAFALSACQDQHANIEPVLSLNDTDGITYELAKKYVKNYEKRAGTIDSVYSKTLLSKVKKLPDTRAIWFSADRLEKLVAKVKSEGGDGIRFYLATYDSVYTGESIGGHTPKRDCWNRNTLVLVPTKDSTNKVGQKFHQDYYTTKSTVTADSKTAKSLAVGSVVSNRGEICPPPKDCKSTGATLIQ